MNCNLIKQKIDQLIFENNEMSVEEVFKHIESCNSCQSYYDESLVAINFIGLLKEEPKLQNPSELTNSILSSIENVNQIRNVTINKPHKIIHLVRRSLAVASVSLMLIFGVEQYIVFNKILKLEDANSIISIEHKNKSFKSIIHFNVGMNSELYQQIFNKYPSNINHQKIKTGFMLARLSSIAANNIDSKKINQFKKAAVAFNGDKVFTLK